MTRHFPSDSNWDPADKAIDALMEASRNSDLKALNAAYQACVVLGVTTIPLKTCDEPDSLFPLSDYYLMLRRRIEMVEEYLAHG